MPQTLKKLRKIEILINAACREFNTQRKSPKHMNRVLAALLDIHEELIISIKHGIKD